jgi:glutamate synthase domain-containing protein 3
MSGGEAYVFDESDRFQDLCNTEMVDLEDVAAEEDRTSLRRLLEEHRRTTGSASAARILDQWEELSHHFVKVMPRDYKRALTERVMRDEQAVEVGVAAGAISGDSDG